MIADLDETIKQLLIAELPIKNGEIDVAFDQPTREWRATVKKPTINLFLYDVRENVALRRHQWEMTANGNSSDHIARMKRSPFRVDCYYMITAWATEAEDEHRVLTRLLVSLLRHPILPEERLVGQMQHQPYDVQAAVARHDKLTNPAEVWGALDNEMRPSISYIVTLAIDPWVEVSGPIVRSLTLRAGQADKLPGHHTLNPAATDVERLTIGGTVWRKDIPQANVEVAVKGTGFFTTTDDQGRFTLGGLPIVGQPEVGQPPVAYTLVAWPAESKPVEKKITISDSDYDITL